LINNFFDEVERVLTGHGIPVRVIHTDDERSKA